MQKKYTAKLLLFGEHTIIQGSSALALPFGDYYGIWSDQLNTVPKNDHSKSSLDSLKNILGYLKGLKNKQELKSTLNLDKFEKDINSNLWFYSNIPTGYGLGSSGAVCAAIYDRYCNTPENELTKLKDALAQLEGCFHGRSSGVDPLVCYLNQMLLLKSDKEITALPTPNLSNLTGAAIFLVDTGVSRQTTPLVNYFLEQSQIEDFYKNCVFPLSKSTDIAITAFMQKDLPSLLEQTNILSEIQYIYLKKMILPEFWDIWQNGLKNNSYSLKLCGAGGGGFILGFTADWERTKRELSKQQLKLVLAL
ncbi:MAG: mevalonate kinase [Aureispira sp.]|nr:mevalonate kinase [Aureispira sp.]